MSSMIFFMQMLIWLIVTIMIGLVAIFIYSTSSYNSKLNNNSMTNESDITEDKSEMYEDNGLNSYANDDEGPIQHL